MKHIALIYNQTMDWYYYIKINKKSITYQRAKYQGERPPVAIFSENQKISIENALDRYPDDNVLLMKFYE